MARANQEKAGQLARANQEQGLLVRANMEVSEQLEAMRLEMERLKALHEETRQELKRCQEEQQNNIFPKESHSAPSSR